MKTKVTVEKKTGTGLRTSTQTSITAAEAIEFMLRAHVADAGEGMNSELARRLARTWSSHLMQITGQANAA